MTEAAEDTKQRIMRPAVYQVGAELKRQYNNLRKLLAISEPPLRLAEKVSDTEFEAMAERAIKERKLPVRLEDGTEKPIEFSDINKRFNLLSEENRKKIGISNLNINAVIPREETINKVSSAIDEVKKDSEGFSLGVFFKALFNLIVGLFSGKGLNWTEAKAQAAIPHIQEKINDKLSELARQDVAVSNFLAQKSGDKSVQENILAAVPQGVYQHFKLTVPEDVKIAEPANIITSTAMGKAIEFKKDDIISGIREKILFPKQGESLSDQIATKIFAASEAKRKKSEQEYENISLTSPLQKSKAYAKREIINELALSSAEEAKKVADVAATAVADGISKAVADPKFASLNKDQATALISEKITKELEMQRKELTIVKTLYSTTATAAVGTMETFGMDALRELPEKIGKNKYSVIKFDELKRDIIAGVSSSITEEMYGKLRQAGLAISSDIKDKAMRVAGNTKLLVSADKPVSNPVGMPPPTEQRSEINR